MKEVKHYICEVCNTEYHDKKKCTDCEKGHKLPMNILKASYKPITINALGTPYVIEIEMNDGSKYEYRR